VREGVIGFRHDESDQCGNSIAFGRAVDFS